MTRRGSWLILVVLAGLGLSISTAHAEDVRGRWSFGLGVGFLSTLDDIRNNAAVLELVDPGLGFPDDIADDNPVEGSIDLRNDDLLGRETEIEERQVYTMTIGYGLTSWLSLQVDLGYYEGNVSNLDTLRISRRYADTDFDNTFKLGDSDPLSTPLRDSSVPIGIGNLEQIPVMVSAVVRFRKDSAFNPILGVGVGWIFTDFNESDAFRDMNREILRGFQRAQIFDGEVENRQIIEDGAGNLIASTTCKLPQDPQVANAQEIFPDFACNPAAVEAYILDWDANVAPVLADTRRQLLEDFTNLTPEEIEIEVAKYIEAQRQAELEPRLESANRTFIPTQPFVTAEVDDGFAYQLIGGAEYHFNEHWSAYVLGRYLATDADLVVRIADNSNTVTPTNLSEPTTFETNEARFFFLSESNCNISGTVLDPCSQGLEISKNQQPSLTNDEIFVQGGKINLTTFAIGFGVRYTF